MEEKDWDANPLPNAGSGITPTTQSDEDDGDVVVVPIAPSKTPSIFPPSNHEGLPVTPPPSPPQDQYVHEQTLATSSPRPSYSGVDENEWSGHPEAGSTGVKARLGIFSSGVLRIAYGFRSRTGFWSIASVAAMIVVAVCGRRWQRWRSWRRRVQKEKLDQMMLLINQKDEKIKQLLIQIHQMNEILLAPRTVPVHRIVVKRPFMNKQRLPS